MRGHDECFVCGGRVAGIDATCLVCNDRPADQRWHERVCVHVRCYADLAEHADALDEYLTAAYLAGFRP